MRHREKTVAGLISDTSRIGRFGLLSDASPDKTVLAFQPPEKTRQVKNFQ